MAVATLTAVRVAAVLTLLSILYQFISAGQLLSGHKMAQSLHGDGAIALHVITGFTAITLLIHWRVQHTNRWPWMVMVVVFGLTFVQAKLGDSDILWAHVPGAFLLTFGAIWVAAWTCSRAAHRTTGRRGEPTTTSTDGGDPQ